MDVTFDSALSAEKTALMLRDPALPVAIGSEIGSGNVEMMGLAKPQVPDARSARSAMLHAARNLDAAGCIVHSAFGNAARCRHGVRHHAIVAVDRRRLLCDAARLARLLQYPSDPLKRAVRAVFFFPRLFFFPRRHALRARYGSLHRWQAMRA